MNTFWKGCIGAAVGMGLFMWMGWTHPKEDIKPCALPIRSTTHHLTAVSLQLQPFEPVATTIGRLTSACPKIP